MGEQSLVSSFYEELSTASIGEQSPASMGEQSQAVNTQEVEGVDGTFSTHCQH